MRSMTGQTDLSHGRLACGDDGGMLPGIWRFLRDLITKRSGIGRCLLPAASSGNRTTRRSKRGDHGVDASDEWAARVDSVVSC